MELLLHKKLFVPFQDLDEMGNSMKKYYCMLESNNEKISANQMSLNVPRSPFTDAAITTGQLQSATKTFCRNSKLDHVMILFLSTI